MARREYEAHGLPFHDAAYAVGSLAEACTIIRRLWTSNQPFDHHGSYHDLVGAFCNPKPVQRPHPPILIGGRSAATLRVVAEHADVWNPGDDLDDAIARSALLDRLCAEIGRDPDVITRSLVLPVSYDQPRATSSPWSCHRRWAGLAERRRRGPTAAWAGLPCVRRRGPPCGRERPSVRR